MTTHVPFLCFSCVTARDQVATTLTLVSRIDDEKLRLPDEESVIIKGMCAQSEHVLLVCDVKKGRVKSVSISTDAVHVDVTVCFQEADRDWRVLGCLLVDADDGQFLAVAENGRDSKQQRVVFAGPRDAAGSFAVHNVVQLPGEEYSHVCTRSFHSLKPSCFSSLNKLETVKLAGRNRTEGAIYFAGSLPRLPEFPP